MSNIRNSNQPQHRKKTAATEMTGNGLFLHSHSLPSFSFPRDFHWVIPIPKHAQQNNKASMQRVDSRATEKQFRGKKWTSIVKK